MSPECLIPSDPYIGALIALLPLLFFLLGWRWGERRRATFYLGPEDLRR
jgi:hypothetical protein